MEPLQIAQLLPGRIDNALAFSALPDAPVLPHADSLPLRTRKAIASGLRRTADVLAPPVHPAPSRFRLSVGP